MVWGSMVERYAVSLSIAGFSGTPSSLLPEDLGECLFEAENEGQHCSFGILSNSIEVARVQSAEPDRQLPRASIEAVAICYSSCLAITGPWTGEILSVLSDEQHVVPPLIHLASDWSPESILMPGKTEEEICRRYVGDSGRIPFRISFRILHFGAFQVLGASDFWRFGISRTYLRLRNMVAKSTDPVYHCLIDTGALVMGFTNEEVAKLLLKLLPEDLFEP